MTCFIDPIPPTPYSLKAGDEQPSPQLGTTPPSGYFVVKKHIPANEYALLATVTIGIKHFKAAIAILHMERQRYEERQGHSLHVSKLILELHGASTAQVEALNTEFSKLPLRNCSSLIIQASSTHVTALLVDGVFKNVSCRQLRIQTDDRKPLDLRSIKAPWVEVKGAQLLPFLFPWNSLRIESCKMESAAFLELMDSVERLPTINCTTVGDNFIAPKVEVTEAESGKHLAAKIVELANKWRNLRARDLGAVMLSEEAFGAFCIELRKHGSMDGIIDAWPGLMNLSQ